MTRIPAAALTIAAGLLTFAPAAAQPAHASGPAVESSGSEPDARSANPFADERELTAVALSEEELKMERGGQTLVVNQQTLLGVVQGNYLNGDYVAGAVSLNDSAFSNFTGLLTLAINTGLQSNVIAGMSVTININD